MVVSGLDFGSRIFFTWVDLVEMGKVVFKNTTMVGDDMSVLSLKGRAILVMVRAAEIIPVGVI